MLHLEQRVETVTPQASVHCRERGMTLVAYHRGCLLRARPKEVKTQHTTSGLVSVAEDRLRHLARQLRQKPACRLRVPAILILKTPADFVDGWEEWLNIW
jgi:hypothetical protein